MTEEVGALRRLMAWAAGAPWPEEVGDSAALDTDLAMKTLHAHRLDARFLHRLREPGAPPVAADLVGRVRQRVAATEKRVHDQRALFTSLAEAVRSDGTGDRLVMLKGSTLYSYTGHPRALRFSRDLDIVTRDPQNAVHACRAVGLEELAGLSILDELALFRHEDLDYIEVHSYFPIPVFPPDARNGSADPVRHPGPWRNEVRLAEHRLQHADMIQDADADCGAVSPELAVIVQAAHLFGDYLRTVLPLPAGTVRLDEVAAIADFCALPAFDGTRFRELVDRHSAHDAIAFVRALTVDLLARDPFAGLLPPDPVRVFPVDLWWDGVEGFLADLGWRPWELVVREQPPEATLQPMSPLHLAVRAGEPATVGAVAGEPEGDGRYVHRAEPGADGALSVTFTDCGSTLSILVRVAPTPKGQFTAVSLNFGDKRYEVFHVPAADRVRVDDYSIAGGGTASVEARLDRSEDADELTIDVPWPAFEKDSPDSRRALLLGIRRQYDPWSGTASGVILPLLLECG